MKKVAIYLRVSTADQAKGLASQEKAIVEYCHNHNIKKSEITFYKDLGVSGKTANRKSFKKLQAAIFQGKHDCVICWSLDRLSRSQKDGINILHKWLQKGIRVISISQQFNWSGEMGKLVSGIMFALAEWQREALSEATKRGLQRAKAKGKKLGKRSTLPTNEILTLLDKGEPVVAIAKRYGTSRQSIYNLIERSKNAA